MITVNCYANKYGKQRTFHILRIFGRYSRPCSYLGVWLGIPANSSPRSRRRDHRWNREWAFRLKLKHRRCIPAGTLAPQILGPQIANLSGKFTDALMLTGEFGFVLMLLEGGLDVELGQLYGLLPRAFGVATVGQLVAIASGMGIGFVFGLSAKSAFTSGVVLAPMSTSVVLAIYRQVRLQALTPRCPAAEHTLTPPQWRALDSPTGQLILSAAVLDDIYSLILLSELKSLKEGGLKNILVPIFSSLGACMQNQDLCRRTYDSYPGCAGYLFVIGAIAIGPFPRWIRELLLPLVPKVSEPGTGSAACRARVRKALDLPLRSGTGRGSSSCWSCWWQRGWRRPSTRATHPATSGSSSLASPFAACRWCTMSGTIR